jgi:rhodanese-related sulfurtransferase
MEPNPDFLPVVKANFPPTAPLLVGCLSGGRSLEAATILAQAGYQNVSNVRCGFGGEKNLFGKIVEPGWAALGLPVEVEEVGGRCYQTLLERVPN